MTLGNFLNLYNSAVRNTCGRVFEALSNIVDTVNTVCFCNDDGDNN